MPTRVRIRGPSGQSAISLDDSATIHDLRSQIAEKTGLALGNYATKYGYPDLKPLELDQLSPELKITDLGISLNGEQLIISAREPSTTMSIEDDTGRQALSTTANMEAEIPLAQSQQPLQLLPSTRNNPHEGAEDPPEIPSPEHAGTFVLRIMPDDNSCLFRAVGNAVIGGMDTMTELRSIVAQTIQAYPDEYSEAVLEKRPDDYCRWIQNENSWGGGIELSILSKHFDIEVCSIDVQTLRVDRFNEGALTRCVVVYSGIHYDTIALSPSDPPYTHAYAPPEFDTKIFDAADPIVLERALELCKILQQRHYFTDTAGFRVRCNTCGGTFVGEKGATQHAMQTGHYDFGEAG